MSPEVQEAPWRPLLRQGQADRADLPDTRWIRVRACRAVQGTSRQRTECQELQGSPQRSSQDFSTLCAQSHADAKFAQAFAHRPGGHAKDARNGKHGSHQPHDAESQGGNARREQHGLEQAAPCLVIDRKAGIEFENLAAHGGGQLRGVAPRPYDEESGTIGCAQKRQKHRRRLRFSQKLIFPVLDNADDLDKCAVLKFEAVTDRGWH